MMTEDQRIDITVDPEDLDTGALKILNIIRPAWKQEDIVRKPIGEDTGGVNLLYRYVNTKTDDAIVIRVFGKGLDKYMDREEEIKAHRLLSDLGIGPELSGVFNNGFFCAFVEGKTYSFLERHEERGGLKLAKAAVRKIAVCHSKDTAKLAVEKYGMKNEMTIHGIWDTFMDDWRPWMDDVFPIIKTPEFPTKKEVRVELDMVKKIVADFNLPLVFCHNDFHPGNVIYDVEKDRGTIIDLEFCSFYYGAYDLAFYLFYSSFGLGLEPSEDARPVHPPDYQSAFLKEYLNTISHHDKWPHPVTQADLDTLQKQVNIFFLLVIIAHIPVMLMIAAKPAQLEADSHNIVRGCVKAWKLYLIKRKEFLGY